MPTGFQLSGIVLISASAFPRQSLDADTLAFLTCSCVVDTSIVILNTYCLALCNCSPQLISTSAFQRQSLDADTPALHLRRRHFNCDFGGLDVPEIQCRGLFCFDILWYVKESRGLGNHLGAGNSACAPLTGAGTSLSSMWSPPIQLILLLTLSHTSRQLTVSKLCCSACMPLFFCLWYNSSSRDFLRPHVGPRPAYLTPRYFPPTTEL